MATSVATSFPDSTYTASNKPSAATLKADIQAVETAVNTHNAATTGEHGVSGTIVGSSDAQTLTNKVISGATNTLSVLSAAWPVGSVFTSVVATNPNTLLGFGTWSSIAAGRMLIGLDSVDSKFDTVEETGGAETAQLTTTELPAHDHTYSGTTSGQSQTHTHTIPFSNGDQDGSGSNGTVNGGATTSGNASVDHTHTYSGTTASAGTGSAFSIMNPYFTVYFWKRTA